jgi:hypothetical protein
MYGDNERLLERVDQMKARADEAQGAAIALEMLHDRNRTLEQREAQLARSLEQMVVRNRVLRRQVKERAEREGEGEGEGSHAAAAEAAIREAREDEEMQAVLAECARSNQPSQSRQRDMWQLAAAEVIQGRRGDS